MKITKEKVEYIAHLARLRVDDSLVEKYAAQLSEILGYIDKLGEIDLTGVDTVAGASFDTNVMRPDEPVRSPGPDLTLANAPERDDDFYQVPRIVK
ncbi:MAG: Asp-tRNA(Asn)/Glu-tRNA(Gln) amidotransferase subunit GatC [Desulfobacteraceae bacterium]